MVGGSLGVRKKKGTLRPTFERNPIEGKREFLFFFRVIDDS